MFNPLLPQFEMKKPTNKKTQKQNGGILSRQISKVAGQALSELVLVKRSGLQGGGQCICLWKSTLRTQNLINLQPGSSQYLQQWGYQCLHSAERQSATREKSLGLHPNAASGLVTFGWDVGKTVLNYRLLFFKKLKNKNNTNRIKKGKIFCHFEKLSIKNSEEK